MISSIKRMITPARAQRTTATDATQVASSDVPRIELIPAGLHVSAQPCIIWSVIGAGLVVALFDPTTGIGGASHFVLPRAGPKCAEPLKYGDTAMRILVDRLLRLGARRHCLTAKLFGGAQVQSTIREERWNYGVANADIARALLSSERIPLHTEDLGGTRGRKLDFATSDGTVWMKVL